MRTVYTFVNFDIDHLSFFYQELEILELDMMIAIMWWQWSQYPVECRHKLNGLEAGSLQRVLNPKLTNKLSETFSHWQAASFTLAAVFFSVLIFYWGPYQAESWCQVLAFRTHNSWA